MAINFEKIEAGMTLVDIHSTQMTYYVVTLDGSGRIEERGITGPFETVPTLDTSAQPHALIIEIADGGTVRYGDPRALKCSAPSRVMPESLPCTHARSSWQHCPWCLGINSYVTGDPITVPVTFTVSPAAVTSAAVEEPPPNRESPHYCCCGEDFDRKPDLHRHRERCRTHKVHRAMRGNCGDVRGRRGSPAQPAGGSGCASGTPNGTSLTPPPWAKCDVLAQPLHMHEVRPRVYVDRMIQLVCIGLDLSKTRPGACIIHHGGWKAWSVDPLKVWATWVASGGGGCSDTASPGAAMAGLRLWIGDLVELAHDIPGPATHATLAVIEEAFVHSKNPRTGIVLGQVLGVAMAELAASGVYFIVVPAPVARRAVLGFSPVGADVKGQIRRAPALKGMEFADSDATDAYVLARYGMDLLRSVGLDGVQRMHAKVKTPPKKRRRNPK